MDTRLSRLVQRVAICDESALAELFGHYRDRLHQIIESRMDRRLKRRIDAADVLQETYIVLNRKLSSFAEIAGKISVFVWMRRVAIERLIHAHRKHLVAEKRDARKEVPLVCCEQLGRIENSVTGKLRSPLSGETGLTLRQERNATVLSVIQSLDTLDSEIITLRVFDELSNIEVARLLHLSENGASSRYCRAMFRLKQRLEGVPDLNE